MTMSRRTLGHAALCTAAVLWLGMPVAALAADETPDELIKRLSTDVLNTVRSDKSIKSGDINKITALVDKVILPHVNFRRMTAAAVGPAWRQATPQQQTRLQDEFKSLLVRTYSGALNQVNDLSIQVKPLRARRRRQGRARAFRDPGPRRPYPARLPPGEDPRATARAGRSTT